MKRLSGRIASLFVILFFGVLIYSAFAAIESGSNEEAGISITAAGEEAQIVVAEALVKQDMTVFSDPEKDDEDKDDEDKDDDEDRKKVIDPGFFRD